MNTEEIQDCCESGIWGGAGEMVRRQGFPVQVLSHPRASPSDGGNLTEIQRDHSSEGMKVKYWELEEEANLLRCSKELG